MVITGLTRNQFAGSAGTRVRIPPSPLTAKGVWEKTLFSNTPYIFFTSGFKPGSMLTGSKNDPVPSRFFSLVQPFIRLFNCPIRRMGKIIFR